MELIKKDIFDLDGADQLLPTQRNMDQLLRQINNLVIENKALSARIDDIKVLKPPAKTPKIRTVLGLYLR